MWRGRRAADDQCGVAGIAGIDSILISLIQYAVEGRTDAVCKHSGKYRNFFDSLLLLLAKAPSEPTTAVRASAWRQGDDGRRSEKASARKGATSSRRRRRCVMDRYDMGMRRRRSLCVFAARARQTAIAHNFIIEHRRRQA